MPATTALNALVPVLAVQAATAAGMVGLQKIGATEGALALGYASSIVTVCGTVAVCFIRHFWPRPIAPRSPISRRTPRRRISKRRRAKPTP